MVDRNLLREFNIAEDELDSTFANLLDVGEYGDIELVYTSTSESFDSGKIITGIVLRREGDDVLVDVGYKSEGVVPANEWDPEEPRPNRVSRLKFCSKKSRTSKASCSCPAARRSGNATGNGSFPSTKRGIASRGRCCGRSRGASSSTSA